MSPDDLATLDSYDLRAFNNPDARFCGALGVSFTRNDPIGQFPASTYSKSLLSISRVNTTPVDLANAFFPAYVDTDGKAGICIASDNGPYVAQSDCDFGFEYGHWLETVYLTCSPPTDDPGYCSGSGTGN